MAPRVLPKVGQSSSPSLPETPPSFLCPSSTPQVFGVWPLCARLSLLSVPSTPWQLLLCRQKAVHGRGTSGLGALGHGVSRSGQAGGSCRGLPRACVPAAAGRGGGAGPTPALPAPLPCPCRRAAERIFVVPVFLNLKRVKPT